MWCARRTKLVVLSDFGSLAKEEREGFVSQRHNKVELAFGRPGRGGVALAIASSAT